MKGLWKMFIYFKCFTNDKISPQKQNNLLFFFPKSPVNRWAFCTCPNFYILNLRAYGTLKMFELLSYFNTNH